MPRPVVTDMHCARCAALLEDEVVAIVDSPVGIIATIPHHVARETRWCLCGWSYTRASTKTRVHQPTLRLIEGAA